MKKVFLFIVLLLHFIRISAQNTTKLSEKQITVGINIGANYSALTSKSLTSASPPVKIFNGNAFRLGIIANYQLTELFSISPKAELAFNDPDIKFTDENGETLRYGINPISTDLMAHLVLKKRSAKLKPYIFLGPEVKIPLFKGDINTAIYPLHPDFGIDIGIGLEKSFTHFNFAPELRYTYGSFKQEQLQGKEKISVHNLSLLFSFSG